MGNVVLNRVADKQFPNTVKEVIFDDKYAIQFEPVENGTVYDEPTDSAVLAAKISLEGADVIGRRSTSTRLSSLRSTGSIRTGPSI